jgi:hypothetical protein
MSLTPKRGKKNWKNGLALVQNIGNNNNEYSALEARVTSLELLVKENNQNSKRILTILEKSKEKSKDIESSFWKYLSSCVVDGIFIFKNDTPQRNELLSTFADAHHFDLDEVKEDVKASKKSMEN